MDIHYYGHSTISFKANGKTILVDPFFRGNPLIADQVKPEDIVCDYILITHGHADHTSDLQLVAMNTKAKVICSWEIHEWLFNHNISNTHPMNIGGSLDTGDFKLKCVYAQHSAGLPDGANGGQTPAVFI